MTFNIRNKILAGFGLICIVIGLAGIVSVQQINHLKTTSEHVSEENAPLVDAIMEIKFFTAHAHLFFEEILSGDTSENIQMVWQEFEQAQWYCNAILNGGQNSEGRFIPSKDPLIRNKIGETKKYLDEFIDLAKKRYTFHTTNSKPGSDVEGRIRTNSSYAGAGTQMDEQFDLLFEKVLLSSDEAETLIQKAMKIGVESIKNTATQGRRFIIITALITLFISLTIGFILSKNISDPIDTLTQMLKKAAKGDLDEDVAIKRDDEIGQMADSFQQMIVTQRQAAGFADQVGEGDYSVTIQARSPKDRLSIALGNMTRRLSEMNAQSQHQIWLTQTLAGLVEKIRGELKLSKLAQIICTYLSENLNAQMATLYLLDDNDKLIRHGDYAFDLATKTPAPISMGQGLVGQTAQSGKMMSVTDIPEDYFRINSSLGDTKPTHIIVCPFLFEGQVKGVVEMASHLTFSNATLQCLKNSMESVAVAVSSAQTHARINDLLEQTQQNNEELQIQQEELQVANEELEEKTKALQESEAELQAQQEELRVTNEELEEKNRFMTEKQREIKQKNIALEDIKKHLELKAEQLEISGKYKSEFLANMSHELRTPLNSLLILAQDLKNNNDGNLTDVQVESAQVIYKGGNDLLKLINEILDLSKIEAGKMTINLETIIFPEMIKKLKSQFDQVASEKGLNFETKLHQDLPSTMVSDFQRLEQILRNLCSNALKFTNKGKVFIEIKMAGKEHDSISKTHQPAVAFIISDTGIGISKDKQLEIFEAFQQVDGSTSREFGGTGLGLSISRELAALLGGVIHLKSKPGTGSTFKLLLPLKLERQKTEDKENTKKAQIIPPSLEIETSTSPYESENQTQAISIDDDQDNIKENDQVILVIEDDLDFAATLKKFCIKRNFKFLHAGDGFPGLILAEKYRPNGIILDIRLPGMSGWDVLNSLKKNKKTRYIPVHIMSVEDTSDEAVSKGAIGFLNKPATLESLEAAFKKIESISSREVKELLVVEDDKNLRFSIIKLVDDDTVNITAVASGIDAIEMLQQNEYDCMILDLSLPDKSGYEVLKEMADLTKTVKPPVIIYTGRELTQEQEWKLKKYASSIILKTAYSTERLMDETALFLHKVSSTQHGKRLRHLENKSFKEEFENRKILLVDDDMRNLFALSKVLNDKGFKVHQAADGEKALNILKQKDDIELVIMDIMMPIMDGCEATMQIRKMDKYKKVPVIALTAKAMPADRVKCIDAGASDYITKPVDINNLLSLIRIWI